MGQTIGLVRMAKLTGFSVGEIAAARGIPLYSQRLAQGLKPHEAMPSHDIPKWKKVEGNKKPRRGTPGIYRAMMEALGRGNEVNVAVKPPKPFARRNRIRMSRRAKKNK